MVPSIAPPRYSATACELKTPCGTVQVMAQLTRVPLRLTPRTLQPRRGSVGTDRAGSMQLVKLVLPEPEFPDWSCEVNCQSPALAASSARAEAATSTGSTPTSNRVPQLINFMAVPSNQ